MKSVCQYSGVARGGQGGARAPILINIKTFVLINYAQNYLGILEVEKGGEKGSSQFCNTVLHLGTLRLDSFVLLQITIQIIWTMEDSKISNST